MTIDFGVRLPRYPPEGGEPARDYYARTLNGLSERFTTVWLDDHVQFGDTPLDEAWVLLSYLAGAHPRFRYGHMVNCQRFRNPALLAKMAASLQHLTGGQFILGLGAGWHREEHAAYNFGFGSPAERVEQLAETIEIVRALWTQAPATYRGQHCQIENAYCAPRPTPPPPIWVGTQGRKALAVTARLADVWNWNYGPDFAPAYQTLRQACAAMGRDFNELWLTLTGTVRFTPDGAAGDGGQIGPTPAAALAQLRPYVALGVRHLAFVFADSDTLARFDADVTPALALA